MFTKINTISTRKANTVEEITREIKTLVYAEFINDETLDEEEINSELQSCIKDKGNGTVKVTTPQRGNNAGIEVKRVVYTDDNYFKITQSLWDKVGLDGHYLEPVQAGDNIYMFKFEGYTKKDDALFGGAVHSSKHSGLGQLINIEDKFTLVKDEEVLVQAREYNEEVLEVYKVVII